MKEPILIRAHHLLCIPRFYRGGYDETFAKNMKNICTRIRKNPLTKIKVVSGDLDILCQKCPHKKGSECIQSKRIGKWVVEQDKKVMKYLKLKSDSIHFAKDVFNLGIQKVNETTIRDICKGCIFLNNCVHVGVNNSFKKDLNKKAL